MYNSTIAQFNRAINWQPRCVKHQTRWTFNDFYGNPWPVMFATKTAAYEMGMRHIDAVLTRLKEEMNRERDKH